MIPWWNYTTSDLKQKIKQDLRDAEAKLIEFSRSFDSGCKREHDGAVNCSCGKHQHDTTTNNDICSITTFDTKIPRSAIPLHAGLNQYYSSYCSSNMNVVGVADDDDESAYDSDDNPEDDLTIHGIKIVSNRNKGISNNNNNNTCKQKSPTNNNNTETTDTPLVLLHGYMNASAYFYRNFWGLSRYYQTIYSLDLLGWGLSSRPTWHLKDETVPTAEEFFVESLEAWRKQQNISKMILAGHSLGGYLSVAYCERYPQFVDRLILLSPVGIQDQDENVLQNRGDLFNSSLRGRAFRFFFDSFTVGTFFRSIPYFHSLTLCQSYVQRRLGHIFKQDYQYATTNDTSTIPATKRTTTTTTTQQRIQMTRELEENAVTTYLHSNIILPGSGECCLNRFLTSNIAGVKPLKYRIPKLKVRNVNILYGTTDWMDPTGGKRTQELCNELRTRQPKQYQDHSPPTVNIYLVRDAGHLLMLENWKEFNACVIHAGGGHFVMNDKSLLPILIHRGSDDNDDDESDPVLAKINNKNTAVTSIRER